MKTPVNVAAPELQGALWEGDLHSVTTALINGADPNALAAYGDPMLVVASSRGHLAIVEALLEHGADPNLSTQNGTALSRAVVYGHPQVAEILMKAGATVTWGDAEEAALYGRSDLLKNSLDRGIPVTQQGNTGSMLLLSAAFGGHTEAVQLLIDAGADVNASNGTGWTALLAAATNGKGDVVKLLLLAGTDPNVADKSGDTPLKMATQEGHTEIADLLKEAGATA